MLRTGESLTDKLLAGSDSLEATTETVEPLDMAEHYWLARPLYSAELAQEIVDRFVNHANEWTLASTPLAVAMWKAYRVYHGLDQDEDAPQVSLSEAGEHGEFLRLFTNHFRGLIRHQKALITSDRLAWDVQARTADSEALRQVQLTQNICDWAVDARGYGDAFAKALETMLTLGVSYVAQGWDPNAGPKGAGDVWRAVLAPWECVHEDVREHQDKKWDIFVRWESRWDWAAKFATDDPEKARKIIGIDTSDESCSGFRVRNARDDDRSKDRIPLLYLYALPSRALPEGRHTIVAGSEEDLILHDGAYPYGAEPKVRRMCSSQFVGTETPLANSWTLLPIQEAHDVINSVVLTRADLYGVPNVAVPDGVDFEASDIGGANKIGLPPGTEMPPIVLDFLNLPSGLPKERENCVEDMQMLSGINSVTRGNPSENITSGSMAALVQQMAQQYNSDDQRAYVTCIEQTVTDMIGIYQTFATEGQLISIAGKSQRYTAREFKADDISLVQRVTVKMGNPATRTVSGRLEIANAMMDRGMFQDPREYLTFVQTGTYEPLYSSAVNEIANIQAENEAIMRGELPAVDVFDNDIIHIREHKCLFDTQLRNDPAALDVARQHMQAHIANAQEKTLNSPEILELIGQQPLAASQAIRQQAEQMEGRNPAPAQPGAPAQKVPNAEPTKAAPGPAAAPQGPQQPRTEPNQPKPATPARSPAP
jgi:hypothetical protein